MADLYTSLPVTIEAYQITDENCATLARWASDNGSYASASDNPISLSIRTLEGTMTAETGDWLIRGTVGEFYPCRDDVFRKKYVFVETDEV